MKKRLFALILVAVLLFLCACTPIEEHGLNNYQAQTCSVGLTMNLFPAEDFLSSFEYTSGDYHYLDTDDWKWGYATAFAYLQYAPDIYQQAKTFCLENLTLCENHQYKHSGYIFSEQLCYDIKTAEGDYIPGCQYPEQFNMFAYNDKACTLIFLGYYNGDPDDPEKELAKSDFGAFINAVYTTQYNFDDREE